MRLFEIVLPTFYLHTNERQRVGSVIPRLGITFPLGSLVEMKLEQVRPEHALPRDRSLYLQTSSHGEAPYIYEVRATGHVDRLHTAWLTKLKDTASDQTGAIDQYATGYWSGNELPEGRNEPWEYRALEVKILKCIGGYETKRSAASVNPLFRRDPAVLL